MEKKLGRNKCHWCDRGRRAKTATGKDDRTRGSESIPVPISVPTNRSSAGQSVPSFSRPKQGLARPEPAACFDIWWATFHILEMLYATPFPHKPQTDHAEKADRNADLIARYEAGETGACIAKAFGISEQRMNQIIRRRPR